MGDGDFRILVTGDPGAWTPPGAGAGVSFVFEWVAGRGRVLAALRRDRYDAVLVDAAGPGSEGLDLARRIRRRYPALPVVMVLGPEAPGPLQEAAEAAGVLECVAAGALDRAFFRRLRGVLAALRAGREGARAMAARCEALARCLPPESWEWDLAAGTFTCSPALGTALGLGRGEAAAGDPEAFFARVHPDDRPRLEARIGMHLEGGNECWECDFRLRQADGAYRWVKGRGAAVRDGAGCPVRLLGGHEDHSTRESAGAEAVRAAFHDPLTDLPNRVLFLDRLGQCLRSAPRRRRRFAVLFLDLDGFKQVNDTFGHPAGDRVLREVGRRLLQCVRPGDTVARLGGDEFTVLVDGIRHIRDATRVAERIQRALEAPFPLGDRRVRVSASIGIAFGGQGAARAEDLIRDADMAMYRAKSLGKSRHEVFDVQLHALAAESERIEAQLRRAVEAGELQVFYQPIVTLRTGRVSGFEALVRWRHPERGLLEPEAFLPAAERAGLMERLDLWVLREASRQVHDWHRRMNGGPRLFLGVNIGGGTLSRPGFGGEVRRVLADTGLEPCRLRLEIADRSLLSDPAALAGALLDLAALDVQVGIDDFGAGDASLSLAALDRLPIHSLKIDPTFIRRVGEGDAGLEIAHAIVTLAHNLDMDVTAEGIESEAQLVHLRTVECDYGQGAVFSMPIEAAAAEGLIADRFRG
ncbi:EAL domain-containing protein [Dissulfurirhabdus thermomarina]|uniref:EAL domain-containing protein n=1 Tax=Dissulfurirhabdus thermomarina TaxID=1765737 RepID=A0A6N9TJJ7_DISTH|nr:EAL domain-containing protein [Dissulfurirhabdus thermomarina]NDY41431.1 EAL domain-containing protein [Dissulfurirhabdus thermomarina]NMX24419.1 EAL domain-containing protein [Dissulfurirhabdus thermomarina]